MFSRCRGTRRGLIGLLGACAGSQQTGNKKYEAPIAHNLCQKENSRSLSHVGVHRRGTVSRSTEWNPRIGRQREILERRNLSYGENRFECKYRDFRQISDIFSGQSGVKSCSDSPAPPRCGAGVTHNVFAPRSFRRRSFAWKIGPLSLLLRIRSSPLLPLVRQHEGRGAWVLTAYGICGLALFGLLAYFFSDFISH